MKCTSQSVSQLVCVFDSVQTHVTAHFKTTDMFFIFSIYFLLLFLPLDAIPTVPDPTPTLYAISIGVQVDEQLLYLDVTEGDEKIEPTASVRLVSNIENQFPWGLVKQKHDGESQHTFAIIHRQSGFALDIKRGSEEQGTGLWLYDYHGGISQLFELYLLGSTSHFEVLFRSLLSGFLVDVNVRGDGIWVWPFENSSSTQRWLITPMDSGSFEDFISSEPEEVAVAVKECEETIDQEAEWVRLGGISSHTIGFKCADLQWSAVSPWEEFKNISMFEEAAVKDSFKWHWVREVYQHLACFLDSLEVYFTTLTMPSASEQLMSTATSADLLLFEASAVLGIGEFEDKAVDRWGWVTVLQEKQDTSKMFLHGGLSIARIHLAAVRKLRSLLSRCLVQGANCKQGVSEERKHIVMGHYYSSRPDPQRGCAPGYDRVSYLANWTISLSKLKGAEALLFHDGLSADFMQRLHTSTDSPITFWRVNSSDASSLPESQPASLPESQTEKECKLNLDPVIWNKLCKALPPNDLRFLVSLKQLSSGGKPGDLVLITDLNDVGFHRDVFTFMELMMTSSERSGYDLFIGDELESNMGFMMQAINKCYPRGGEGFSSGTVFNSGVIGGTREAVSWLLGKMVEEFALALEQHGGKRFASGAVCDMASMNKVLWKLITRDDTMSVNGHFYRVFSGYPLVSPFKGYAPAENWHYISHK